MAYGRKRVYRRAGSKRYVKKAVPRKKYRGINLLSLQRFRRTSEARRRRRRSRVPSLLSLSRHGGSSSNNVTRFGHPPLPSNNTEFTPGERESIKDLDRMLAESGNRDEEEEERVNDNTPIVDKAARFLSGMGSRNIRALATFGSGVGLPLVDSIGEYLASNLDKYARSRYKGRFNTTSKIGNALLSFLDGEERKGSVNKYTDKLGRTLLGISNLKNYTQSLPAEVRDYFNFKKNPRYIQGYKYPNRTYLRPSESVTDFWNRGGPPSSPYKPPRVSSYIPSVNTYREQPPPPGLFDNVWDGINIDGPTDEELMAKLNFLWGRDKKKTQSLYTPIAARVAKRRNPALSPSRIRNMKENHDRNMRYIERQIEKENRQATPVSLPSNWFDDAPSSPYIQKKYGL